MREINKADLDNYITGHWGEDQFTDEDREQDAWEKYREQNAVGEEEEDFDDNECYRCDGEGFIVADCFEDTCCCADPELQHGLIPCPLCNGPKKGRG